MTFGPLVSAGWLRARLAADPASVAVVDVRWYLQIPGAEDGRSGLAEYAVAHIPGAVWLDIDSDLSAPANCVTGRHPLPAESAFAGALGRMGIPEGKPVVVYDDAGGAQASRLWFMLHVLGEPVAVLDGGIDAWTRIGGELTDEIPVPFPVLRPVREWPAPRFADADAVGAAGAVLLDARTTDRYEHGGPIDARPGHIPGAVSAPWQDNLGTDGRFRSADELRLRYRSIGGDGAIAYCGSGVTACHDLLALKLAGIDNTRLYVGSWSQWGADAERPVEVGAGIVL
jgi:thiosulfate/3-mercaptopyruvate sulfurtransferase